VTSFVPTLRHGARLQDGGAFVLRPAAKWEWRQWFCASTNEEQPKLPRSFSNSVAAG